MASTQDLRIAHRAASSFQHVSSAAQPTFAIFARRSSTGVQATSLTTGSVLLPSKEYTRVATQSSEHASHQG